MTCSGVCLFLVVIVDEALLPIAWAARLSLNPAQRAGVTSLVAAMPAVMGEGLKPLTTSQTPSENSQSAIGSANSAVEGACCPMDDPEKEAT